MVEEVTGEDGQQPVAGNNNKIRSEIGGQAVNVSPSHRHDSWYYGS